MEGTQALENFKRGMIALFKVPKKAIGGSTAGQSVPAALSHFRVVYSGSISADNSPAQAKTGLERATRQYKWKIRKSSPA